MCIHLSHFSEFDVVWYLISKWHSADFMSLSIPLLLHSLILKTGFWTFLNNLSNFLLLMRTFWIIYETFFSFYFLHFSTFIFNCSPNVLIEPYEHSSAIPWVHYCFCDTNLCSILQLCCLLIHLVLFFPSILAFYNPYCLPSSCTTYYHINSSFFPIWILCRIYWELEF